MSRFLRIFECGHDGCFLFINWCLKYFFNQFVLSPQEIVALCNTKMSRSPSNSRTNFRYLDRIFRQNSNHIPTLPNCPDMKYNNEQERLKTFENKWTKDFIDYHVLARTGMYYIGLRDCVKCQFCHITISEWQVGDDPVCEHFKYSPTCPLLRRERTRNIPSDIGALNCALPPRSPDECGRIRIPPVDDISPKAPPVQVIPAFPHYALEEARTTTFTEWPKVMRHKVPSLVEAGFFYTGRGDQVQCFSCGVTINDWEEDDDPWVQHAVWQPDCKFLQLLRDKEFIESCVANYTEKEKTGSKRIEIERNPYDRQISMASSLGTGDADGNNLCKLCYLEERNTVFLPCGHVVACAKCALSVDKCPVCRLPFTDINRLYFS